jgi:hypothetical protein
VNEDTKQRRFITTKQLEPNKANPAYEVLTVHSRQLVDGEWRELQRLFLDSDFWSKGSETMPLVNSNGEMVVRGDGAHWIFEASIHGNYHVANIWSPKADGPDAAYRKLCLYLLSLSSIQQPEKFIY